MGGVGAYFAKAFSAPKLPKPPVAPEAPSLDTAAEEVDYINKRRGKASTILTGGFGGSSESNQRYLLGAG